MSSIRPSPFPAFAMSFAPFPRRVRVVDLTFSATASRAEQSLECEIMEFGQEHYRAERYLNLHMPTLGHLETFGNGGKMEQLLSAIADTGRRALPARLELQRKSARQAVEAARSERWRNDSQCSERST